MHQDRLLDFDQQFFLDQSVQYEKDGRDHFKYSWNNRSSSSEIDARLDAESNVIEGMPDLLHTHKCM